jgi:TIR domain
MKHDVFISHAHKDKSIAEAICGKLESAGLKCWIATRDISARDDWTEATRNAIGSSRAIVLVLSENANAAPHIEREIAHAFYMRRTILPFRLGETLPRREILFYLGNIPWFDALNPPADEQLEAFAAHVKGLTPVPAGEAPPQGERTKTAPLSPPESWFGALTASHYRTLGILKWVGMTTFLCAVILFLWFALRQTTEWASLAEKHRRSADRSFSLSSSPSPQAEGNASGSKQTSSFTRFGLWQSANGSPTPLVQGSPVPPLDAQAERSPNVTSSPAPDVTPEERTEGVASERRPRHLPPVIHRVSHDHHPQFPGTQVREARKIADLENQRDSLRSQLEDLQAKLLAMQKNADLLTSQRDELQARLDESEKKAQIAQRNADLLTSQRDQLQTRLGESEKKAQIAQRNAEIIARELDDLKGQLKEAEIKAATAQKSEEQLRTQRDALQTRVGETESDAQAAQKNAELATRQRDALESEMGEVRERAQLAETNANLAASQRDALEARLKKEESEAQESKGQLNQHGADLAKLPESAPDTQFEAVRQDIQPARQDTEIAQMQPPNPGQNAKSASITQSLDSFVQPTSLPRN